MLRTRLASGNHSIDTVEHLMAALMARGITNCTVRLWGTEVPIHDGSASPWCFLLDCAGTVTQSVAARFIKVLAPVSVRRGDAWCSLVPGEWSSYEYNMNYTHPLIGSQNCMFTLDSQEFDRDIAAAQTFGFYRDMELVHELGLAKGASLSNTTIYGDTHVLGPRQPRWDNEPVRHKICDAIGDLALAGAQILGHFQGHKSGHDLNHGLVKSLLSSPANYTVITFP